MVALQDREPSLQEPAPSSSPPHALTLPAPRGPPPRRGLLHVPSLGLGMRRSNSWEKVISLGTSENSRTLLVKVWPDDLQSKNHLGPSEKCRISVLTSDPLN